MAPIRAISPKVKNTLRFAAEVPAVPWKLPSRFERPERGYLCTYLPPIVGSIYAVMDVEDVQVDYMKVLISPYRRDICISGIYRMLLIE